MKDGDEHSGQEQTAHCPAGDRGSTAGGPSWALALLTEVYRGGPMVAIQGPLGQLRGRPVTVDALLDLCPPAGVDQLARFREVFEAALIPPLAARHGLWAIGPTFAGSALIKADADLIAGGLLLDLKTVAAKPSLGVKDAYQLIGYALLDFGDEYRTTAAGLFSARYGYLATWELPRLLEDLAGRKVSLSGLRKEFEDLLIASQPAYPAQLNGHLCEETHRD